MNNSDYELCEKELKKSKAGESLWARLYKKLGYSSKESLRKQFNREAARRGENKSREYIAPVVGVIDLETLPMELAGFTLYPDRFSTNAILRDSCLLSWSAMYVKTGQIVSDVLTSEEAVARDTRRLAETARDFIRSCDILIGHNIKNFDDKIFNTEFLLHRLGPVSHRQIDTLEIARAKFHFPSNKLSYINQRLGIKQKMENEGLPLWKKCSAGEPEALSAMLDYNIQDVIATEELYWTIRPYATNVPTFQPYPNSKRNTCDCGGSNKHDGGYFYTNNGQYRRLVCDSCGALFRDKENLLPKERRTNILIPI